MYPWLTPFSAAIALASLLIGALNEGARSCARSDSAGPAFAGRCRPSSAAGGGKIAHAYMAPCARAKDFIVVLSADAKPYREAAKTAAADLKARGHKVATMQLADFATDRDNVARLKQAEGIIAIGASAARTIHTFKPVAAPLVACMIADPEQAGLTKGRPTITVSTEAPFSARLTLIKQALPKARHLAMLYRGDDAQEQARVKAMRANLPQGWKLTTIDIRNHDTVANAIAGMLQAKPDIVLTHPDANLYDFAAIRALLLRSLHARIPVFGFSKQMVRAGALIGVCVEPADQGAQAAAHLVKRVARIEAQNKPGAVDPQELQPTVEPADVRTAVNLIVSKSIGIAIPDALVKQTDFVYGKKEGR